MKKAIFGVLFVVVAGAALAHWYFSDRGRFTTAPVFTGLARSASGNELLSRQDPAAVLRFGSDYQYIGGQKFVLYGIADTEQHFFVETYPDNSLKSFYWVQYEAYVPGNNYTYNYEHSPLRVALGEYEFFTNTSAVEFDHSKKRRAGTDGAMVRAFLASKGYLYPGNFAYARLVYLTDESRRKELMIIFIEDLKSYGVTAAQLNSDGESEGEMADRWLEIEKAHLDRIKTTLTMAPMN